MEATAAIVPMDPLRLKTWFMKMPGVVFFLQTIVPPMESVLDVPHPELEGAIKM